MRTNQYFLKYKTLLIKRLTTFLVPSAGIEPAHLSILEFESSASTNSANWALINWCANIGLFFILKNIFCGIFTFKTQFPNHQKQVLHFQEVANLLHHEILNDD